MLALRPDNGNNGSCVEGRLPRPIHFGASSRWIKSEVDAKLAEAADRRAEAA